jgi:hypothetical protein
VIDLQCVVAHFRQSPRIEAALGEPALELGVGRLLLLLLLLLLLMLLLLLLLSRLLFQGVVFVAI